MPIAKETKTYDPAPAGTHVARCFGCVSLGTQHSPMFADAFKVMLMFELPFETIQTEEGPKPMTISKEYTLSLGKRANLRKHLDAWRGKPFTQDELNGFEVSNVVGAPCQLTVVHVNKQDGGIYAKIEGVTGLAKGMQCPPQVHQSVKYEIDDGENAQFKVLPEWIQRKILASEEVTPTGAKPEPEDRANMDADEPGDDTPF